MEVKFCAKHPYPTADKARKAMHSAIARRGKKTNHPGMKVTTYKCAVCDQYHWGHYSTRTTPKRKRKDA